MAIINSEDADQNTARMKERQSNFELLRIISMFCIVLYHLIRFFVEPLHPDEPFWKAVQIPLHLGVLLFVMISGYFQIRTAAKGIVHLMFLTFLYYTPIEVLSDLVLHRYGSILGEFLFLSHGQYWFILTYLMLYLLSPAINGYINQSPKNLFYLFLVTGVTSVWFGLFSEDPSLIGGKNIINFIFLYLIGVYFRKRNSFVQSLPALCPIVLFVVTNMISMISYTQGSGDIMGWVIKCAFEYNSPLLIFNAVLVFVIFSKIRLKSNYINYVAKSSLSVYLIHYQPHILSLVLHPLCYKLNAFITSASLLFPALAIVTIIVMGGCIFLDKVIEPIYKRAEDKLLYYFIKCINL